MRGEPETNKGLAPSRGILIIFLYYYLGRRHQGLYLSALRLSHFF